MKVSDLIKNLSEIQKQIGDVEVGIFEADAWAEGDLADTELFISVGTDEVTGESRVTFVNGDIAAALELAEGSFDN